MDLDHKSVHGKKRSYSYLAMALLLAGTTAFAGPAKQAKKAESVPGQFVVELKQDASVFGLRALESKLGGKIVNHVRPNMVTIQRNLREERTMVVRKLNAMAEVAKAEPNFIFHALTAPNDPDFGKLWGIKNSGGLDSENTRGLAGVDVGVDRAWDIQKGSKDILVAIVDTGIDYNHPDLKHNVWTNQAEANGKTGVDDDNNGYVDDIHGMNFVNNTGNPLDDNGHGSHVAGTIGAEPNNGIGVAGVNWNVSIIAVKFLDGSGSGSLDNAIKAIDYARKSGARISSNSWGGNVVSDILEQAIGMTKDADQLFVVAAGNDSDDNDKGSTVPAIYKFDNIVSVAAIDNRGELAYFSNFGAKTVHLAAPGVNVMSTFKDGGYETYSGTSMACPHVSGVAALLFADKPSSTYAEVKERLMKSARPTKATEGKTVTGGVVDAYYALTGNTPPADPNDPSIWTDSVSQATSSDHPYADSTEKTFTVKVPGAKRIAVHFSKFETEAGYDKVQFINAAGESLGSWSGKQSGRFGPITEGDTLTLKFTSDSSQNGYGFDIDAVSVER